MFYVGAALTVFVLSGATGYDLAGWIAYGVGALGLIIMWRSR